MYSGATATDFDNKKKAATAAYRYLSLLIPDWFLSLSWKRKVSTVWSAIEKFMNIVFRDAQLKGQSRKMDIFKIYKTLVFKTDAFKKFFE
jgi:hypothetical protein